MPRGNFNNYEKDDYYYQRGGGDGGRDYYRVNNSWSRERGRGRGRGRGGGYNGSGPRVDPSQKADFIRLMMESPITHQTTWSDAQAMIDRDPRYFCIHWTARKFIFDEFMQDLKARADRETKRERERQLADQRALVPLLVREELARIRWEEDEAAFQEVNQE